MGADPLDAGTTAPGGLRVAVEGRRAARSSATRRAPRIFESASPTSRATGQPDVLLEQDPGTNHGCGPHTVVATLAHRQVWRLFRSWLCETTLHGDRGLLALELPYYVGHDSVCCWSKVERRRLHWNGRRYVGSVGQDRADPPALRSAEPCGVLLLVVRAVLAGLDRLPPGAVLAVPGDRLGEAVGERARGLPAERAQLRSCRASSGGRGRGGRRRGLTSDGVGAGELEDRLVDRRFSTSSPPPTL